MSKTFWDCGPFDQHGIDAMAGAYDDVCRAKPTMDRELVARQITNLAKLGLHAANGTMNRQHEETHFDEVPHVLMCLCGGHMLLALVEPIEEAHELYRFECKECHCATSVLFKSAER
jgi:hypothetical protein